jgi:hypothetical protein
MRRSDVAVNFMVDVCSVQLGGGDVGCACWKDPWAKSTNQKLWSAFNKIMNDCHWWFCLRLLLRLGRGV